MAPTNFNLDTLRGHTFKGFVQFQAPDGGAYFRLKERQTMSLNMRYDRVKHYQDDGTLHVDPAGVSHSFDMRIKLTSDMIDNVFSASSDKKTLSYWIQQCNLHQPVEAIFVGTMETFSGPAGFTSEKFIHFKFTLDPSNFSPSLNTGGGSPEITVGGIVLRVESVVRTANNTAP